MKEAHIAELDGEEADLLIEEATNDLLKEKIIEEERRKNGVQKEDPKDEIPSEEKLK